MNPPSGHSSHYTTSSNFPQPGPPSFASSSSSNPPYSQRHGQPVLPPMVPGQIQHPGPPPVNAYQYTGPPNPPQPGPPATVSYWSNPPYSQYYSQPLLPPMVPGQVQHLGPLPVNAYQYTGPPNPPRPGPPANASYWSNPPYSLYHGQPPPALPGQFQPPILPPVYPHQHTIPPNSPLPGLLAHVANLENSNLPSIPVYRHSALPFDLMPVPAGISFLSNPPSSLDAGHPLQPSPKRGPGRPLGRKNNPKTDENPRKELSKNNEDKHGNEVKDDDEDDGDTEEDEDDGYADEAPPEPPKPSGEGSTISDEEADEDGDGDGRIETTKIPQGLTDSVGTIPPDLPPSVEAAYRKKCIQLKTRLNEIEEANDAYRQRLARSARSIQKMRLERAFLLESLAKRTSTNVEDSEGSPSPPPTPKEKPLRVKRGHRKPDFLTSDLGDGRPGSTFIQQGPVALSPSSDAFSHTHPDSTQLRNSTPQAAGTAHALNKRPLPSNGTHSNLSANSSSSQPRRPKNAFDLYCNETRPVLASEHRQEIADGTYDVEATLARGWSTLEQERKNEFTQRYEQLKRLSEAEKEANSGSGVPRQGASGSEHRPTADEADEDIEMADEVGTPSVPESGGFTAVNRA